MSSNVHIIGAPRKAGRRRERPIPNVPLAKVVSVVDRLERKKYLKPETAAEKALRLENDLRLVAGFLKLAADEVRDREEHNWHLLRAIRVIGVSQGVFTEEEVRKKNCAGEVERLERLKKRRDLDAILERALDKPASREMR
ncbi:hypothetical protein ABH944_002972 [Caballeronia udeis]|uniref:Uncharacterized protein n=1 Tax=Caballeronia udeis TaxID=1232866 RepID=A0ABW8MGP4_9BURK